MPTLSVADQVRALQSALTDVQQRQVPFAVARALTETAQLARNTVTRALPAVFDKPTPFTLRAVTIQTASKSSLTAAVYVRPVQAEYLALQETGGTRLPRNRALAMPRAIGRNAYGNIPRGAIGAALARPDVFSGKVGNTPGVWFRGKAPKGGSQRQARPVLLVRYVRQASYRPRFGFSERVDRVARAAFPGLLADSMTRALETARP